MATRHDAYRPFDMLATALALHWEQEVPPGADVDPLGQDAQAALEFAPVVVGADPDGHLMHVVEPDALLVPCIISATNALRAHEGQEATVIPCNTNVWAYVATLPKQQVLAPSFNINVRHARPTGLQGAQVLLEEAPNAVDDVPAEQLVHLGEAGKVLYVPCRHIQKQR